jgi:hypothetical protein
MAAIDIAHGWLAGPCRRLGCPAPMAASRFPLSVSGTMRTGRARKLQNSFSAGCSCTSILPTARCPPHPTTRQTNPESWLQSHLLGPSLQNAPRQPCCLFLLFFDTHCLPPSSKYCLLFFFFPPLYSSTKILHHLHRCPHLRVSQEAKDAS